jgi:hypothetical protein
MILTFDDAASVALAVGFREADDSAAIIVAIGAAESSLNTLARHVNNDGSIDRGWLQINDRAHRDVNDSCAYDAACAARAAYRISSDGASYHAWAVYNSGAYAKFLGQARQAVGRVAPDPATPLLVL